MYSYSIATIYISLLTLPFALHSGYCMLVYWLEIISTCVEMVWQCYPNRLQTSSIIGLVNMHCAIIWWQVEEYLYRQYSTSDVITLHINFHEKIFVVQHYSQNIFNKLFPPNYDIIIETIMWCVAMFIMKL